MRKIAKHTPPRNVSPDGQAPRTMQQAERDLLASLPGKPELERAEHARRAHFDTLDKRKLRDALRAEQKGICVYCERRIRREDRGPPIPPIEHWQPLSHAPELALHWANLYLSCNTDDTCDDLKKDRRLRWDEHDADLPWPADAPYESWIGFTSRGEAYVRADAPIDEATRRTLELAIDDRHDGIRNRKSIVRLNYPRLIADREAEIDRERIRLNEAFPGQTATVEEREARAAALLAEDPCPPFVSVRVAWLRKTLGKP